MRYIYLLLAMFVLPQFLSAQSNYKPGSVVTTQGDTLKGFINYREWDINPESIDFKTDIGGNDIRQFNVDNARAFDITGLDVYRKYRLKISTDKVDINNLSNGIDTGSTVKSLFLHQLATGSKVTLYEYNDGVKIHYFIQEINGKPHELLYHIFNSPNREQTIVRDRYYQLQLTQFADRLMPDNETLINQINRADYREDNLVRVADLINGSTKKQSVSAVRLFVGGGVSFNKLKFNTFNPYAPYGKNNANINSPIVPVIGFGADFLRNVNIRKIFIRTEVYFSIAPYKMSARDAIYKTARYDEHFTQINGTFSPQLVYNIYKKPNVMVYVDAGFNLTVSAYTNEGQTLTYQDINATAPMQGIKDDFNNVWYSLVGKVGVLLSKHYELYAGYMPSAMISDKFINVHQSAVQVGFHYILGKK